MYNTHVLQANGSVVAKGPRIALCFMPFEQRVNSKLKLKETIKLRESYTKRQNEFRKLTYEGLRKILGIPVY